MGYIFHVKFTDPTNQESETVLLVEDQVAIRQMLARLVSAVPGFAVVAQAGSPQEAIRQNDTAKPSVVVLDWGLGGDSAAMFLRHIKSCENPPKVLVFSANTAGIVVREAFALGVLGYIEKTATFEEFISGLQCVAKGRSYMGPAVSSIIAQIVRNPNFDSSCLTIRETETLRLVSEGLSSKMIASRLGISIRTVHSHRASIIRKTGLHSIAELTLYACEQGLSDHVLAS